MSSKAQFKEALKGDKQIIRELKKENAKLQERLELRAKIIDIQHHQLLERLEKKRWWQFWK